MAKSTATQTAQDLRDRQEFFQDGIDEIRKERLAAEVFPRKYLTEMFQMQTTLDQRIIDDRGIDKSTDEWVRDITIAIESELDEIRREVNWKWWKNPQPIDHKALQGEVIDVWHFLLSLSRVVGLQPEDIYRQYMDKNAENHARQDGTSDKGGYELVDGKGNE